jgi:hypothetical protein
MFALLFHGPNDCDAPSVGGAFPTQAQAQRRLQQLIARWVAAGALQLPIAVISNTDQ